MSDCTNCCEAEPCKDEFFAFAEDVACSFVEVWNAQFSGAFVDTEGNAVMLERAMYRNPEVILFWNDGTKSTAHCAKEDKFSLEVGLLIAVAERVWGKKNVDALFEDWLPYSYTETVDAEHTEYIVSLADVRKMHRIAEEAEKKATKAAEIQAIKEYLESCGYKVEKK